MMVQVAAVLVLVGTIVGMPATQPRAPADYVQVSVRIDAVETEGASVDPGTVVTLRYRPDQIPQRRPLNLGDQIRANVKPDGAAGEGVLAATQALKVIGRGEFVNPGEGAVFDQGSPEAKVLVKFFAPLAPQCHQDTAKLLRELAAREPERVRVQIFDMTQPAARAEMRRERLGCATVLVNNRLNFRLGAGDGSRAVSFSHRPNVPRSSYNSEDVIAVVEQELARLYPEQEKARGEQAEKKAP
jgi:hypothetical protein